jgi:glycosyltransferase involved in cell wall biosynthesis
VLSRERFRRHFSDDGIPGHDAEIHSKGWKAWIGRLTPEVKKRAGSSGEHVIAHTFGDAAAPLVAELPGASHLETHVGYDRAPFGAKRVYVSDTWRHFLWGKYPNDEGDRRYSWVVLPYYESEAWPLVKSPAGYVAYMGRITSAKGMRTLGAIAEARPNWKIRIAGSGNVVPFKLPKNVKYLGILPGKDRASFLGNARVLLCPTDYVEPCAGVVCEAAMTGTPTVGSSWGGFGETIIPGITGYTAATLAEWISGVDKASGLDRVAISTSAVTRFGLGAAARQYAVIVERLLSIKKPNGWYLGVEPSLAARKAAR